MIAKKRKVALVYDAIFPYIKGGGERRFFELAKRLARDGYDVHLYGMKYWQGAPVIKRDGITYHGLCKARPLYTKSGRRSISQPIIFGLSCFKMLFEKHDIIDCSGFPYFSLFPCRLIAWIKRKPLYATWHEVWGLNYWREYLGLLGYVGFVVEWIATRLPDVIIAVSPETAERLTGIGTRKKIVIAENGIDLDHIIHLRPASQISDIIYCGRLTATKQIDLMLHAVALIKKSGFNIRCFVVGDGPDRAKLERLAMRLGIDTIVRFTGFIEDHDDMLRIVKASKVFVLPSKREGFGLVVVEANAAGVPVVTVDAPDNAAKQLINGQNGLVANQNSKDLAASIKLALIKPFESDQCVSAARQYDWSNILGKLKEVMV